MYLNDKKHRITLRLNDQQFAFIRGTAEILDVSPSELLRMMVNTAMVTKKAADEAIRGGGRENDKADSDDKL